MPASWRRCAKRPRQSATWRSWRTTPRRPGTGRRCWSSRSPPPSRPPRLHAHREAAAQYARALRFADRLARRRARPPARGTIGRLLLERSRRGGDRGAPGGARHLAHVGRPAQGGGESPLALAPLLARGQTPPKRRPPRWRCWSPCRPGRSWRWPTATSPSCGCSTTISRGRSGGAIGRSPSPRSSGRRKPSSTR